MISTLRINQYDIFPSLISFFYFVAGVIFNPATDGMSGGDCWGLSAVSTGAHAFTVIAQDRWSKNMRTPSYDAVQSLTDVAGYANATNQVVYFKRALQTGDADDAQFCTTAGCRVIMVFAEGERALTGITMGMHRLV